MKQEPVVTNEQLAHGLQSWKRNEPLSAERVRDIYERAITEGSLRHVQVRRSMATDMLGRSICGFCKTRTSRKDKYCRECGAGIQS